MSQAPHAGNKAGSIEPQPPSTLKRGRGRPRKVAHGPSVPLEKADDVFAPAIAPASLERGPPRISPRERVNDHFANPVSTPKAPMKAGKELTHSVSIPKTDSVRGRGRVRGRPRKSNEDLPVSREAGDNTEDSLGDATSELQRRIEEDISDSLTTLKVEILKGLTGKRRLPLVNLEQEYQELHQLVEQTVLAGEGNSVIIIGSRGTAKTTLVETAIADMAQDHRDVFHVIRLNGFIHTDDKIALREIWRQLGREMEVDDDSMCIKGNYADTLTSLLALLSHPAQEAANAPDHAANSVIFILDEFDLFASHPRQTLLYNLFDVAQSRSAPVLVIGVTTRVEIVNSLEKRVKSRFGQRYIHLSLPRNLVSFHSICQSAFSPPAPSSIRFTPAGQDFLKLVGAWRTYIGALFEHDTNLQTLLQTIYSHSKSVPAFLSAALIPIHQLTPSSLLSFSTTTAPPLLPPDSRLHLLPSLSDASLALLIAAARFHIAYDTEKINFNMAYHEYVELAEKAKAASSAAGQSAVADGTRILGRWVARGLWENLVDLELVVPVGGEGLQNMFRVDVALEEIAPSVPGLGGAMARWCKEI